LIVADTGAVLALIDADDRHHESLLEIYEANPDSWILPWAILPEVDYLLQHHVSDAAELAFVRDIADGRYEVEWGEAQDLARAREVLDRYKRLGMGLVDGVVIAVAERLQASAIATLDVRHFGAVRIDGAPKLLPRDR
jgi:predicted nucleic acid-binding protein